MLDLVRGYYTTSMALYPDEKRTWQELHHALLLQQMLEHFLKGWPVLFVFHLDSKVAHSDTVWILHLLQITEHSFTHRQGFIKCERCSSLQAETCLLSEYQPPSSLPTARV